MVLDRNVFINKKVIIEKEGKEFFYTVEEIIELTDTHIFFKDKFGDTRGVRISDIKEVM